MHIIAEPLTREWQIESRLAFVILWLALLLALPAALAFYLPWPSAFLVIGADTALWLIALLLHLIGRSAFQSPSRQDIRKLYASRGG